MFKESAHGNYTLSFSNGIVYCDYSQGFNISGVKNLTEEILALTANIESWVLFQRPTPTAGITNDAIKEMMQSYLLLQQNGCKAVAIVENSIFVYAGSGYQPEGLTIPFRIKKEEAVLLDWLTEILNGK